MELINILIEFGLFSFMVVVTVCQFLDAPLTVMVQNDENARNPQKLLECKPDILF